MGFCTDRKQFGGITRLSEDRLIAELENFSADALPVHQISRDPKQGLESRIDKAAVWMWVWLEVYCSNLAAEVLSFVSFHAFHKLGPGLRIGCSPLLLYSDLAYLKRLAHHRDGRCQARQSLRLGLPPNSAILSSKLHQF